MMTNELSTGKTIFILAVVVGCFAILWPKVFYPMLTASVKTSAQPDAVIHPHVRPERPSSLHSEALHPALREKGRTMPQRTIEKEARPGPMPGLRPPMGGGGHMVPPQSKGSGAMGIIMPLYTVGIVIFFIYTIMKVLFKKNCEEDKTPKLKDFHLDPEYRKYVFAEEYLDSANASHRDLLRRQEREASRQRRRQEVTPPDTKIGKPECEQISSAISLILADLDMVSKEVDARKDALKEELEEARKREEAAKDNASIEKVKEINLQEENKFVAKSHEFTKLGEYSSFEDTLSHMSKFHSHHLENKFIIPNEEIYTTKVTSVSSNSAKLDLKSSSTINQLLNFDCDKFVKNYQIGHSPEDLTKLADNMTNKYSGRINFNKSEYRIAELSNENLNPLFKNQPSCFKNSGNVETYKCSCNDYSPRVVNYENHSAADRGVNTVKNRRIYHHNTELPDNIHEDIICSCSKGKDLQFHVPTKRELKSKFGSSHSDDIKSKTQNHTDRNPANESCGDLLNGNATKVTDTVIENLKNKIGSCQVVETSNDESLSSEKLRENKIVISRVINIIGEQNNDIKMANSDVIHPERTETTFDLCIPDTKIGGVNISNLASKNRQNFLDSTCIDEIIEEVELLKSNSHAFQIPHLLNDIIVRPRVPQQLNINNNHNNTSIKEINEYENNTYEDNFYERSKSTKTNLTEIQIGQCSIEDVTSTTEDGDMILIKKASVEYPYSNKEQISFNDNQQKRFNKDISKGNKDRLQSAAVSLQNLSNSLFEEKEQDTQTRTSRRKNKNAARKFRRQQRFKTFDISINKDAMGLDDVTNSTASKDGAASSSSPPDPSFVIPQSNITPKAEEAVLLASKVVKNSLKQSPSGQAQTAEDDDDETVETKVDRTSTSDFSENHTKKGNLNRTATEGESSGSEIGKYGYEVLKNAVIEKESEKCDERPKADELRCPKYPIGSGNVDSSVEELANCVKGAPPLVSSTGD